MICRKQDELALKSTQSCQSCIANRQGRDTSNSYSQSLFRSLWIKSSLIGDNMIQHQTQQHHPKLEKSFDMELCEDNYELKWADEEFYETETMPGSPVDIWKKFDLGEILPTPPSSPEHESHHSLDCPFSLFDLLDDRLPAVSKVPENCEKCGPLNTKLIQDCMWSAAQPSITEPAPKTPTPTSKCSVLKTTDINANSSTVGNRNRTYSCSGDVPNSSECVDPTSVFPYPLSETPVRGGLVGAQSCMDTPSPSESEDEEEIDVVTVPTTRRSTRPTHGSPSSSSSASAQVAAMHNYSNSCTSSSSSSTSSMAGHHLDHHYSAPYTQSAPQSPANQHPHHSTAHSLLKRARPTSMPCSPQPPSKRHRGTVNESELKRACQKLYSSGRGHHKHSHRAGNHGSHGSSRTSSDSEEGEGKRAQHNVLERKRRNDLKYSFCKLRANIPEISGSERTPKVTILKKASDYVHSVTHRHQALEAELQRQKARHELLKQKLAQLRRADLSFL